MRAGDRIDRYSLIESIGEGGQGSVWKVHDPIEDVDRALKIIPTSSPETFERARREAHALAKSPHPNLIACYGFFEDVNQGFAGIVLELVVGQQLQEAATDPRLDDEKKSALLLQLAEALAHVHASDIVHRDLKPENVLVTDAFWEKPKGPGTVKLVDFGIATKLGNPRPITHFGQIVGTAPYLAPEVLEPSIAPENNQTFVRDVFAFGVLAYELFTGTFPTKLSSDASGPELIDAYVKAVKGEAPWPPPGLPPRWEGPIGRCLAIRPQDRPSSGLDLLDLVLGRSSTVVPTSESIVIPITTSAFDHVESADVRPIERPKSVPTLDPDAEREAAMPPPSPSRTSDRAKRRSMRPKRKTGSTVPFWIALLLFVAIGIYAEVTSHALSRAAANLGALLQAKFGSGPPAPPPTNEPKEDDAATTHPKPPPAPSVCPATCCGGPNCAASKENARVCLHGKCAACSSGRSCIAQSCESRLDVKESWLLRVATITENGRDLIPRPKLCIKKSGDPDKDEVCTAGGNTPTAGTRLKISGADLASKGIDVTATLANGATVTGTKITHANIGASALCLGLNFRFTGGDGQSYALTLFLDDDD